MYIYNVWWLWQWLWLPAGAKRIVIYNVFTNGSGSKLATQKKTVNADFKTWESFVVWDLTCFADPLRTCNTTLCMYKHLRSTCLNDFAPTRTLLHTYNRHDHHHHHHHHHHHLYLHEGSKLATLSEQYVDWGKKKQLYLHQRSKFTTPYEQYVDWGNNINYISMRDQN